MSRVVLAGLLLFGASAAIHAAEEKDARASVKFVPDVTEEEWQAAVEMAPGEAHPKVVKGDERVKPPTGMRQGETATVKLLLLIRADGSQGVYRLEETNNARFAKEAIKVVRRLRFEPPQRDGQAVALRYPLTKQVVLKSVSYVP